jgi:hypothetical protein
MNVSKNPSKLKPLFFGRLTRIIFGIAILGIFAVLGVGKIGVIGTAIIIFLGVSFLLGGLMGNPGCEITAFPNLFRAREKRLHCK